MKAVILCGGSGTRLWPISRQSKPKQFVNIISERSLLGETVSRLKIFFSEDDIYFSTIPEFVQEVKRVCPTAKDDHILVEPQKRDTGPAMGFVSACLVNKFPDEPVGFFQSDHFVSNVEIFLDCLKVADRLIRETGKMVDVGVTPIFPDTNLGYTKVDRFLRQVGSVKIYSFSRHAEKPTESVAADYLRDGDFLWHVGYYMWTPRKFLQAFQKTNPIAHEILEKIRVLASQSNWPAIKPLYEQLPKTSFDYLVTEKIDPADVLIIKGEFVWSDIGSWDVLFDQLKKNLDKNANVMRGNCLSIDTVQSLIYGHGQKLIAAIGLDKMIVVDTPDALLICSKEKAADVKKLVEQLKESGQAALV